jgi:hypothetical protein
MKLYNKEYKLTNDFDLSLLYDRIDMMDGNRKEINYIAKALASALAREERNRLTTVVADTSCG